MTKTGHNITESVNHWREYMCNVGRTLRLCVKYNRSCLHLLGSETGPFINTSLNTRKFNYLVVPPNVCIKQMNDHTRREETQRDALICSREVFLEIEVRFSEKGTEERVPPICSISVRYTRKCCETSTYGTNAMSAIVSFPPTSHSCFDNTDSKTPRTRLTSPWYRVTAEGIFSE